MPRSTEVGSCWSDWAFIIALELHEGMRWQWIYYNGA